MMPNPSIRSLKQPKLLRRFVGRVRCMLPNRNSQFVCSTNVGGVEALRDANEIGRGFRFAA